ncbi:EAL domain-containing protein [Yokenella regensburgei]|uniref:EAL domain-containing protein n=1 Tax=Yokenella regensburgei TaxID=158877 RepID=UPI003F167C41
MIVSLDDTYCSELSFLPARSGFGMLVGLEIIVNFVGVSSNVRAPAELILPRLSAADALTLFKEQLALAESCKLFFIQHQLTAWITLSPEIVTALISDEDLAATIARLPFLELCINESFPGLNHGRDNPELAQLCERYPVVLTNYGAGNITSKAIFDGLFKRVMLDKNFVHQRLTSRSFEPFMRAIVSQIAPYCRTVMIAGIDDEKTLKRVAPYQFGAMQGNLWPAVSVPMITTLVHV